MPAHSEDFPWPSYYGHFNFFEMRMNSHKCVDGIRPLGGGVYTLDIANGQTIRAFICECYSFGVAEYMETAEKLDNLDAIIISSNWCSYTYEAKRLCRDNEVALNDIGGFMAALNRSEIWTYLTESEKEIFTERGWL